MQAIIMAGGKGSRLRPLTNEIPKPLVKIIDKPVYNTTRYLLNAAYMRMKNLMVSYTFQKNVVKTLGLENLKVYFTCDNLFTIDSLPDAFDPETINQVNTWAGGSNETAPALTSPLKQNGNAKVYPMNRNFVFGIDLTF